MLKILAGKKLTELAH